MRPSSNIGLNIAVITAALAVLSSCSTYSSNAYGEWETKSATESRVVSVEVEQAEPASITLEAIHLGAEPTVILACAAPLRVHAQVETKTTPYQVRRRARSTLLVKNATNQNLLIYGLGWAVLAPLWAPLIHQAAASEAADEAVETDLGVRTVESGANECVVEVTDEIDIDEAEVRTDQSGETRVEAAAPLRDSRALIVAGDESIEVFSDARGKIAVPLRAILAHGASSSFKLVSRPGGPFESHAELSLAVGPAGGRMGEAISMLVARPAPVSGSTVAPVGARVDAPGEAETAVRDLARQLVTSTDDRRRWLAAARISGLIDWLGGAPLPTDEARRRFREVEQRLQVDSADSKSILSSVDPVITAAPWWAAGHLLKARALHAAGETTAALGALSIAQALTLSETEDAAALRALFTHWAADRPVEIVRGEDLLRVRAARDLAWKEPTRLRTAVSSQRLRSRASTYGATPLAMPSCFALDLPSRIFRDADDTFFFWRFTR